ncbi:MAG: response regulator transcription factor [Thiobacillaceae bacterium]|jgi:transcriptional regulator EpsA|nr:response regulator transcription factor [Thiobacillaceae bacterium]
MEPTRSSHDHEDRDRLIYILETSLDVMKASQFFAWTQGPLQGLLPHEILICGLAEAPGRELRLRYFTATRYFRAEHFDAACNPRQGLITRVIRHWAGVRSPCLVPTPAEACPCDADWLEQLQRLELRSMAAHGIPAPGGGVQAWFGLFRVGEPDLRMAHHLELLLPCMAATYARVVSSELGNSAQAARMSHVLSARELQVLELVREGLSNARIGERLGLSSMTAKNHVQNIRRKLGVKTRGQAVAEALRLGLIQPGRAEL